MFFCYTNRVKATNLDSCVQSASTSLKSRKLEAFFSSHLRSKKGLIQEHSAIKSSLSFLKNIIEFFREYGFDESCLISQTAPPCGLSSYMETTKEITLQSLGCECTCSKARVHNGKCNNLLVIKQSTHLQA